MGKRSFSYASSRSGRQATATSIVCPVYRHSNVSRILAQFLFVLARGGAATRSTHARCQHDAAASKTSASLRGKYVPGKSVRGVRRPGRRRPFVCFSVVGWSGRGGLPGGWWGQHAGVRADACVSDAGRSRAHLRRSGHIGCAVMEKPRRVLRFGRRVLI